MKRTLAMLAAILLPFAAMSASYTNSFERNGVTYVQRGGLTIKDYVVTNVTSSGSSNMTTNDVCGIVTNVVPAPGEFTAWKIASQSGYELPSGLAVVWGDWPGKPNYSDPYTGWYLEYNGAPNDSMVLPAAEDINATHLYSAGDGGYDVVATRQPITRNALGLARLSDIVQLTTTNDVCNIVTNEVAPSWIYGEWVWTGAPDENPGPPVYHASTGLWTIPDIGDFYADIGRSVFAPANATSITWTIYFKSEEVSILVGDAQTEYCELWMDEVNVYSGPTTNAFFHAGDYYQAESATVEEIGYGSGNTFTFYKFSPDPVTASRTATASSTRNALGLARLVDLPPLTNGLPTMAEVSAISQASTNYTDSLYIDLERGSKPVGEAYYANALEDYATGDTKGAIEIFNAIDSSATKSELSSAATDGTNYTDLAVSVAALAGTNFTVTSISSADTTYKSFALTAPTNINQSVQYINITAENPSVLSVLLPEGTGTKDWLIYVQSVTNVSISLPIATWWMADVAYTNDIAPATPTALYFSQIGTGLYLFSRQELAPVTISAP